MLTKAHLHYSVQIGGGTPQYIDSIRDMSLPMNQQFEAIAGNGNVWPTAQYTTSADPMATFSTLDIRSFINAIVAKGGTFHHGLPITSSIPVSAYAQKLQKNGARASGSNHRSFAINDGVIIPRSISVDGTGTAVLNYEILISYDGTNAPIVFSDSVALPTAQPDAYRFGIGKCTVGDVVLNGVQSINFDSGITITRDRGDGDVLPTFQFIATGQPTIRLRAKEIEAIDGPGGSGNIDFYGMTLTATDTILNLRRRMPNNAGVVTASSGYYANASAQHIKIAATGMNAVINPFNSPGGNEAASVEVEIRGNSNADQTTVPFLFAVDQTIA